MTESDSCGRKPKGSARGKSEHRRAGCRVTPGGGDSKESATERYTAAICGKGEKAR